MANIIDNNFQNVKLKLNKEDYWDFFINQDDYSYSSYSGQFYDNNLISYIDLSSSVNIFGNEVHGDNNYVWGESYSNNSTLINIGYTGFDNGLIHFRRDRILNSDFVNLYTKSEYELGEDITLKLHFVNGCTNLYTYDYEKQDDCLKLNGGFLQGFFKTKCGEYEVLPSELEDGDTWSYEFVLKPSEFEKNLRKTLNDEHPNNKGIFFYLGTRAENKWAYLYNSDYECDEIKFMEDYLEDSVIDVNTHKINAFIDMNEDSMDECSSFFGDDYLEDDNLEEQDFSYIEDDMDISGLKYETTKGLVLDENKDYFDTDNKFLLFDRTKDGFTVYNYKEGDKARYYYDKGNGFNENLFLLMDRTKNGYTVNNIGELKKQYRKDYNVYKDLYNNAIAFRITDNGSIGYRYLVEECGEDYSIIEEYSKEGIVIKEEWNVVHVKMQSFINGMKILFYVNGNLVFVSKELPKLNLRSLDENEDKQESVAYNISIGGGTQGLAETILPNYMIDPYRLYPTEKHFGGSFIGYIKSFKMYNDNLELLDILNNFKFETNKIKNN